eukprot:8711480-Heterocapsa_arctica.AAC.1
MVLWLRCAYLRLPADVSGMSSFLWLGGQTLDLTPSRLAIWAPSIRVIYAACNDFRNLAASPMADIKVYMTQSRFNVVANHKRLAKSLADATRRLS